MGAAQIIKDVILRPGAMHITMSFLGCIGTLMKGSGLDTLVGSAFGGLTGIMSGKVRAMRAFRMVSALHNWRIFCRPMRTILMISWHTLRCEETPHLAHQFLRAEKEGNRLFQQLCIERMLLYFFSEGHIHYACHHLALDGDAAPST